jgi:hypothetical protein
MFFLSKTYSNFNETYSHFLWTVSSTVNQVAWHMELVTPSDILDATKSRFITIRPENLGLRNVNSVSFCVDDSLINPQLW